MNGWCNAKSPCSRLNIFIIPMTRRIRNYQDTLWRSEQTSSIEKSSLDLTRAYAEVLSPFFRCVPQSSLCNEAIFVSDFTHGQLYLFARRDHSLFDGRCVQRHLEGEEESRKLENCNLVVTPWPFIALSRCHLSFRILQIPFYDIWMLGFHSWSCCLHWHIFTTFLQFFALWRNTEIRKNMC